MWTELPTSVSTRTRHDHRAVTWDTVTMAQDSLIPNANLLLSLSPQKPLTQPSSIHKVLFESQAPML